MTTPIRVFSTGTEYECWTAVNCARCPRWRMGEDYPDCDLAEALASACVLDGTISRETADRLGWSEENRAILGWPCKEFGQMPIVNLACRQCGAALAPSSLGGTQRLVCWEQRTEACLSVVEPLPAAWLVAASGAEKLPGMDG